MLRHSRQGGEVFLLKPLHTTVISMPCPGTPSPHCLGIAERKTLKLLYHLSFRYVPKAERDSHMLCMNSHHHVRHLSKFLHMRNQHPSKHNKDS